MKGGRELDKTILDIIQFLNEQREPVSSSVIATDLNVSTKTVLNRINEFSSNLADEGIIILKKPRVGIWLEIKNTKSWERIINKNSNSIFDQPKQRMDYIILSLLMSEDPISLEEFSERLYSSYSTVNNDLTAVRQELAKYHLELANIRGLGYEIQGKEKDLRRLFSDKITKTDWLESLTESTNNINYSFLKEEVRRVLVNTKFHLSESNFENLCIHLFIAINRIQHNNYEINEDEEEFSQDFDCEIEKVEEALSLLVERLINKEFPSIEKKMLRIQLSAKQILANKDNDVITQDTVRKVNEMLQVVNQSFHIDLTQDQELIKNLSLHLVPLNYRLKYSIKVQNPLVEEIKKNCPLGFIVANEAVKVLDEPVNGSVGEDEIALLALHFNLALQRNENLQTRFRKKNIIIVCGTGVGTAMMLEFQILDKFGEYINETLVTDSISLENINVSEYDCLISTIPLKDNLEIPYLHVNYFLTESDIKQLQMLLSLDDIDQQLNRFFSEEFFFTHLDASNANDAINKIFDMTKNTIDLPEAFISSVLKREKLFSTEIGNNVAIPHPYDQFDLPSFAIIAILDNPIKWNKKEVQFVLLFIIGKNDKENMQFFYQTISKYLIDSEKINNIIESQRFDVFLKDIKSTITRGGN